MNANKKDRLQKESPPQNETVLSDARQQQLVAIGIVFFQTTPSGILVLEAIYNQYGEVEDFNIISANPAFVRDFDGKNPEGSLYSSLFKSGIEAALLERSKKIMQTGVTFEEEIHYKEMGVDVWFNTVVYKSDNILLFVSENISERKHAEEEALKATALLKQSEELSGTGTWEYNIYTQQLHWSEGMYRLFEIDRSATVTPSVYLDYVIDKERGTAQELVNAIRNGSPAMEVTLRLKIGTGIKTFRIKSTPLQDESGIIEKVLGTDMDVTPAIQSKETIREFNEILLRKNRQLASLNSELTTFTSIAANDYNETLRQLYLSLEFIVKNDAAQLSNAARANVRRAQSAVQKIKLLTEDFISYAKLQDTDTWKRDVNLNAILKEVTEDFDKKNIEIDTDIQCEPLPRISGYPLLIGKVFHHLIENAIRFSKEGEIPVIRITCKEDVPYNKIMHRSVRQGVSYHVITVTDTGIGFAKEFEEIIFEIFRQINTNGKKRGSGIGLAICKKIMDMHEGFITAESEPGTGSSFHCYFPAVIQDQPGFVTAQ